MFKIPSVEIVENSVREYVGKKRWRKVCLLVLTLLPQGKLASRCFIYEKLEEWGLIHFEGNEKVSFLEKTSNAFYDLFEKGLVRKEDLSRLSEKDFEKARLRIMGAVSACKKCRTQSAYQLSPAGRIEALKLLKSLQIHPTQQVHEQYMAA